MTYWKNIIILLFTLGITVIPMTGKLWSKDDKKIYLRGWLFILLAVCSIIIGVLQFRQDFKEQETRDSNQLSVLKNTEDILGNLNSSMSSIENKLMRIEYLNNSLDSLEKKTQYTIIRRDEILMNYNRLNSKLENLYIAERIKLKGGIPIVNIFEEVKWSKDKGIYKINLTFSNSGERTANEFYFNVWFFNTFNHKIVSHKLLSKNIIQGEDLPPVSRTGYNQQLSFPNNTLSLLDTLPIGCLWITYNYKDIILDTTIYKSSGYLWRGVNLDGLSWIMIPAFEKEQILKYANSKGIKL